MVVMIGSGVLLFGGCVTLQRAGETWESSGALKVQIERKYSLRNDYYFFSALDASAGRWKPVMSVWRDATGAMPVENVRSVDSRIGYLFPVDQVATTADGGATWSVFNTSNYFSCGWEGCAPIKDVSLSTVGMGVLAGLKRVGTQWIEFKLETKDFGRTWRPTNGA
jgi:hypothetical protein